MSIRRRIEVVAQRMAGIPPEVAEAMRLAEEERWDEMTDEQLETLAGHGELGQRLRAMSDAQLEALARGEQEV